NKQRKMHLMQGEDPDTLESMMADVHENFQETFELLHKGAKRFGIDLDNLPDVQEPEQLDLEGHPLYNQLKKWHHAVGKIARVAEAGFQSWLKTEAGQDLLWYHSTLLVKTVRQLNSRWA